MKYIATIVALVGCATLAVAADKPAVAPTQLTVGRCIDILNGLLALDHYDKVVGDKVISAQYKLGALRFTIAQSINTLRSVKENLDRAQMGLLTEQLGAAAGKPIQPNSPELAKLNNAYQAMLDKPCDVTPIRIRLADLKIGDGAEDNQIAPSVLALLAPIIDQ